MSDTKTVYRTGPFKEYIASAVRDGSLLTLSGQVSVDSEGAVVGENDFPSQVRQCYANIKEALEQVGATMDDIVDEMWLLTDVQDVMGDIEAIWAIRTEAYGKDPEVTQTMIQIAALVLPELKIEIKCIARC